MKLSERLVAVVWLTKIFSQIHKVPSSEWILSTWQKPRPIWEGQILTEQILLLDWTVSKIMGILPCLMIEVGGSSSLCWAEGPEVFKKAGQISYDSNSASVIPPWPPYQFLLLGFCIEFMPWLPSEMDCDLECGRLRKALSSPSCFWLRCSNTATEALRVSVWLETYLVLKPHLSFLLLVKLFLSYFSSPSLLDFLISLSLQMFLPLLNHQSFLSICLFAIQSAPQMGSDVPLTFLKSLFPNSIIITQSFCYIKCDFLEQRLELVHFHE